MSTIRAREVAVQDSEHSVYKMHEKDSEDSVYKMHKGWEMEDRRGKMGDGRRVWAVGGPCLGAFGSIDEKTRLPEVRARELQEAAAGARRFGTPVQCSASGLVQGLVARKKIMPLVGLLMLMKRRRFKGES